MTEWLADILASVTIGRALIGLGIFLVSIAFSFAMIAIVMIKIPANYFSPHYVESFLPDSPWLVRWGAVIAKNILGVFLICLGIVLSLPGVPGQGILTILLGIIMLDIPGKRPLEARIIQRPSVLAAINRLRVKFNRPPLIMD
ncbi:hypothetical protein BH24ACI3_BH24ACI3_08970 [soil metagenome]